VVVEAGRHEAVVWNGRRIQAFVPTLLSERDLTLSVHAANRCGAAEASVATGAAALPEDYAPLARLLLRAEGIASSYVEGVSAPVVDVVLAEHDPSGRHSPAAWVAANLQATTDAVTHASQAAPLTVSDLCAWHTALMAGSPTPAEHVGHIRTEQGWIGGTSPLDAYLVTAPVAELDTLLADLLDFTNRTDVDPVAQAAVAHAQFEVIHPFADGNGRIGRVLVLWMLTRRLQLLTPPPVSVLLAADVGGYASGLVRFRMSDHNGWVAWFADAVGGASRAQQQLIGSVERLHATWQNRLRTVGLRSDAAAWAVLDLLPRHLVLTAAEVAAALGTTPKGARAALSALAAAGVLTRFGTVSPSGRGRPADLYVSDELLGLAGATPLRR
jgi:Fic family protein